MNHHIPPRLPNFDYSSSGIYFVTFCVQNRRPLLWLSIPVDKVTLSDIVLSDIGRMVEEGIQNIPSIYPHVFVDKYCIMPDHVHVLLRFSPTLEGEMTGIPSVSRIVKHLKATVTKQAGQSTWQKSFHDHIVRDEKDYQNIIDYIEKNPVRWISNQMPCQNSLKGYLA